jgi:hypothetical protein
VNLKWWPFFHISASFVVDEISIGLVHPVRKVEIFLVACVAKVIQFKPANLIRGLVNPKILKNKLYPLHTELKLAGKSKL